MGLVSGILPIYQLMKEFATIHSITSKLGFNQWPCQVSELDAPKLEVPKLEVPAGTCHLQGKGCFFGDMPQKYGFAWKVVPLLSV